MFFIFSLLTLENIDDFGLNPQSAGEWLKNISPSRRICSLRSFRISSPDFLALGEKWNRSLKFGFLSNDSLVLVSPKLGICSPKPLVLPGLSFRLEELLKYDILSWRHRESLLYWDRHDPRTWTHYTALELARTSSLWHTSSLFKGFIMLPSTA